MAHNDPFEGFDQGSEAEDTPKLHQIIMPIENESREQSTPPSSRLRARIGLYAYSPSTKTASSMNGMAPKTVLPVTHSAHKRPAGSADQVSSRASKRHATSSPSSDSPVSSTPTSAKPTGRSAARKAKRYADPYTVTNNLVDSIRPGLMLLMIGLNPGLKTAETGHAYAHPSNLFWKLLHSSGLTTQRHLPSETQDLKDLYSIGNTNLCERPTRDGAGLTTAEQKAGVLIVEEKVRTFRPEVVCIVGKGIWDTMFQVKAGRKLKKGEFEFGWQDERLWLGRETTGDGDVVWEGARTFVATSTSGLAASTLPAEKEAVWKILGDWIVAKRDADKVKVEEN